MKKQILEIQEYFKTKIVNGNFKTEKVDSHYAHIVIDNLYRFKIWVASGESYCEPSSMCQENFMQLPKFSENEKSKLFKKLKKVISDYNENTVLVQKRAEYEKLKEELGL